MIFSQPAEGIYSVDHFFIKNRTVGFKTKKGLYIKLSRWDTYQDAKREKETWDIYFTANNYKSLAYRGYWSGSHANPL